MSEYRMTPEYKELLQTGGKAFPSDQGHGMTLRDWFAGQALTNLARGFDPRIAAGMSYELADAMLKERRHFNAED